MIPIRSLRANAARVLGTTEDKASFEALLDRALNDKDSRVRISAVRALAALKDAQATAPLLEHGSGLVSTATSPGKRSDPNVPYPAEVNELLENRYGPRSPEARNPTMNESLSG